MLSGCLVSAQLVAQCYSKTPSCSWGEYKALKLPTGSLSPKVLPKIQGHLFKHVLYKNVS